MGKTLDILILGCGYTGQRVAKRFLAMGARVTATTRNPQRLDQGGGELNLPPEVRQTVKTLFAVR